MNKQLFEQITHWQYDTFPGATSLSKAFHLKEEVDELVVAIRDKDPDIRLEYADCIMLIYGSAAANGLSYEQIRDAVIEKMEINKKRTWGKPDANGVVSHVKETSESLQPNEINPLDHENMK